MSKIYEGHIIGGTNGAYHEVFVVDDDGRKRPLMMRTDLRNHSPGGFAWGYHGSGPTQLALALLCDVAGEDVALRHYHRFKDERILRLDLSQGWTMPEAEIGTWLGAQGRLTVPIPKLMRTLERDPRGYPIPFIVLRDKSGRPQFTINDVRKTEPARIKRLCQICGKKLEKLVWFVGGARCFTLAQGAFVDGPVHHECGQYALQVCPFLALANYSKLIDDRLLKPGDRPDDLVLARVPHMPPNQPERFGFGCTADYEAFRSDHQGWLYRANTWEYVEWWKGGVRINAPDQMPGLS